MFITSEEDGFIYNEVSLTDLWYALNYKTGYSDHSHVTKDDEPTNDKKTVLKTPYDIKKEDLTIRLDRGFWNLKTGVVGNDIFDLLQTMIKEEFPDQNIAKFNFKPPHYIIITKEFFYHITGYKRDINDSFVRIEIFDFSINAYAENEDFIFRTFFRESPSVDMAIMKESMLIKVVFEWLKMYIKKGIELSEKFELN